MSLSPKQQRFVSEYLTDQNATQAAIRAGYSRKTADVQGPRLLGKVRAQVDDRLKKVEEKSELTAGHVIAALHRIATADIRQAYYPDGRLKPVHEIPDDVAASIVGIDTDDETGEIKKLRFVDKVRPWEMLGKHFAVFREVHEHTGRNGGPIQTQSNAIDFSKVDRATLLKIAGIDGNGFHGNGK